MLSSPTRNAVTPRLSVVTLAVALLCLLLGSSGANAQDLTTFTDTDAAVITTTLSPTVYTTEGQVYTWTATTPSTVTPVTFSTGSVMAAADYLRSKSLATAVASQAPSQTASLRSGQPNIFAAEGSSGGSKRSNVAPLAVAATVAVTAGLLAAALGPAGML